MDIQVGDRVEVLGINRGFGNSYFAAKLTGLHGELYEVEYEKLKATNGSRLRQELESEYIRPYPPKLTKKLYLNDVVDVFDGRAWWKGIVHTLIGVGNEVNSYEVSFEYMNNQIAHFPEKKVRLHQDYVVSSSEWRYKKVRYPKF